MAGPPAATFSVRLLADHDELVPAVGALRWQEWGRAPEPEDPAWWEATTRQEAGRDRLPVSWVALDGAAGGADRVVGAVGLGECDLVERQDVTPWVMGTIVRPDRRGTGVGRALMARLEEWAVVHGFDQVWVATGQAEEFYRRCNWRPVETMRLRTGEPMVVLTKQVPDLGCAMRA